MNESLRKYLGPALMLIGGVLGLLSTVDGFSDFRLPIPVVDDRVDPATTDGAWVIVVEETSQRTPAIARVLTNESFWSGLKARGLKRRLLDIDNPDAAPYKSKADQHGLPCLLILKASGDVLFEGPLPESHDSLEQAVKESTGR
jgi:hypothetical protein